jgi:hypothetical protein
MAIVADVLPDAGRHHDLASQELTWGFVETPCRREAARGL